jgi:hypothetical protein
MAACWPAADLQQDDRRLCDRRHPPEAAPARRLDGCERQYRRERQRANATVLTQAFGTSHPTSSPLSVEIGGFNKTSTPIIKAGYLCVGSQSGDIQVVEAEGGTAAGFTSVQ